MIRWSVTNRPDSSLVDFTVYDNETVYAWIDEPEKNFPWFSEAWDVLIALKEARKNDNSCGAYILKIHERTEGEL